MFACQICKTEHKTFKQAAACQETHWTLKDEQAMRRYLWLWGNDA